MARDIDDFYTNTNRDRKAYNRFKMICYIPIFETVSSRELHYTTTIEFDSAMFRELGIDTI